MRTARKPFLIRKGRKKYIKVGQRFRYGKATITVGSKRSTIRKKGIRMTVPTTYITKKKYRKKVRKMIGNM